MAVVGEPFKYDLFVSYSHGASLADAKFLGTSTELRDWTRRVVEKVVRGLQIGYSGEEKPFTYYLDMNSAESGDKLLAEVSAAVQSSAILLIFMSPTYRDRPWCRQEIDWFFDQAAKDGRGLKQVVLRTVIPAPHTAGHPWPKQLTDSDGSPVHQGEPLFEPALNLPIEFQEGVDGQPFKALNPLINGMIAEIKIKLDALRSQLAAARRLPAPRPNNVERAQIYLQNNACPNIWSSVRTELIKKAIVLPPKMEQDADNLALLNTYRQRRQLALASCHGLVILRTDPDDPVDLQIASGYDDRKILLEANGRHLPWVLIDNVGDEGPDYLEMYELPRVQLSDPEWPQQTIKSLGLG